MKALSHEHVELSSIFMPEHFTGPTSDTENGFRTVPDLLRAVADWMDENDIQDPEAQSLDLKVAFVDNGDEDFYETITLYHLERGK